MMRNLRPLLYLAAVVLGTLCMATACKPKPPTTVAEKRPAEAPPPAAATPVPAPVSSAPDHRRYPESPVTIAPGAQSARLSAGRLLRLRQVRAPGRRALRARDRRRVAEEVPHRPDPDRGPLRRARHERVQPRPRRAARQCRQGLPGVPRRGRRPGQDRLLRRGAAVLHGIEGGLLGEEPPGPPRDHGQVAWRRSRARRCLRLLARRADLRRRPACRRATSTACTGR